MGVDRSGGGDESLAGDDRGAGTDDDVDAVEGVGVAARPIEQIRPSRMPMDTFRMPWTASITTTLLMTTSQVSRTAAALRCSPSRAVLPNPARNSSPGSWESDSTRTVSPESPSLIRSPARGPCVAAYS